MAAYLAGENVADELLQACRDEPELLRDLAEYTAIDRLLTFQADEEDDSVFASEVRARLAGDGDDSLADAVRDRRRGGGGGGGPGGPARPPPPPHTRFPRLLKLAASILVLLGVGVVLLQQRDEPAFAVLERVSGEVYLGADSKIRSAASGMAFPSGSEVYCTPGMNEATVRCRDGSRFTLASGTRAAFTKVDRQYRLTLTEGVMDADVRKQPKGRPLVIDTPDATVTVLGTRLKLCVASESAADLVSSDLHSSTALIVNEGNVEIKVTGNDEGVAVATGEATVAAKNRAIEVTRIDDLSVDHLEIIGATYGARSNWIDVTPQMQSRANGSRLVPVGVFSQLAGDPLPGVIKTLKIEYEIDGKPGQAEFSEVRGQEGTLRTEVTLPMASATGGADSAAVTQSKVSSRNELEYTADVSDTDLLHDLTALSRGWQFEGEATPTTLNDGVHGDTYKVESASSVAWTTAGASATYDLSFGAAGNGWDITSIKSIAAWVNAGFGNQSYTVEIKRKGARDFTVLTTVDYQPLPHGVSGVATDPGATRVTLSADSGVLARGVQFIRFTANRVNSGAHGGAFTFREIDVFGVETAATESLTARSRETLEMESARKE